MGKSWRSRKGGGEMIKPFPTVHSTVEIRSHVSGRPPLCAVVWGSKCTVQLEEVWKVPRPVSGAQPAPQSPATARSHLDGTEQVQKARSHPSP